MALLLTEREAMAELGIRDRAVLLDEIDRGNLRFVLVGKRRRYTRADLEEFVERKREAWRHDHAARAARRDGATARRARRTGTTISGSGVIGIEQARERLRRKKRS